MRLFLLAVLAAIVLVIPSHASWGPGGCGPVGPGSVSVGYQWVKYAPGEFALFLDGRQIGALRAKGRAYFKLLPDDSWQSATCPCELPKGVCRCPGGCSCPPDDCPCDPDDCPCKRKAKEQAKPKPDVPPTGVIVEEVERSKGKHILNGKEVSKEEVIGAIQKASVPSDQSKLRLTLIGQKDATDAILGDLKGIPETKDMLVQTYLPDHWAVAGEHNLSGGKPFSIALQSPDGKVLHRQWDYDGGILPLAEALRDAKADYDAGRDPDRRHLALNLNSLFKDVPMEFLLLVAAVVLLVLIYKRNK